MQIRECNTIRQPGCHNEAHWSDYGERLSSLELRSIFAASLDGCASFSREGAELGPQLPLIQVFTPKRGNTHA